MTTSTNAILCYGIPVDTDSIDHDMIKAKYPDACDSDGHEGFFVDWWCVGEEMKKETDCRIEAHCSYDCPMYILRPADKEARIIAYRGDEVQIFPDKLQNLTNTKERWNEALQKSLGILDLPWTEPGWYLVSMCG